MSFKSLAIALAACSLFSSCTWSVNRLPEPAPPAVTHEDITRMERVAERAEEAAKRAEVAADKAEVIFHKSLQK